MAKLPLGLVHEVVLGDDWLSEVHFSDGIHDTPLLASRLLNGMDNLQPTAFVPDRRVGDRR